MSSLDDIKKKLNIDEMDTSSRKRMFEKFVEKGGQVIKEKNTKKPTHFNRDKQIEVNEKLRQKNEKLRQKYSQKKDQSTRHSAGAANFKKRYSFFTFLRGVFNSYFSLSMHFSKKITKNILDDFNQILSSVNFVCGQIMSLEPELKWKIIDFLNSGYSYSFEILMRLYDLYKINSVYKIQNYFRNVNHIRCDDILENMVALYEDLVILYPYWETCKEQVWKALVYYETLVNVQPALTKSKVNRYIDRLFDYYLPFFHMVLIYNFNTKTPFELEPMKEFIGIKKEAEVGVFTKQIIEEKKKYLEELEKEKEDRKKVLKESVEKKEMEKIPKYIQKGLALIDAITESIPNRIKNDKNGRLFEANEKMLYFYFLFKEFDQEYSFILTSSQLKLTTRLESGVRTDIRSELDEEFIKFNEISNFIKEYTDLMEEFHNLKIELEDSPLLLNQKLTNQNIKRARTFNEIRLKATILFKKFAVSLQKIINDYRGEKLLLQNPEENLEFTLNRGTTRKFEGVPIIKAIAAAFSFSSALHHYLTFSELSQKSLYLDNQEEDKQAETEQ